MTKNERKSPEYVPHGPVRTTPLRGARVSGTPPQHLNGATGSFAVLPEVNTAIMPAVPDAESDRMKAAHAARMALPAPPPAPPTLIETIEEAAKDGSLAQLVDADVAHAIAEAGGKLSPENVRGLIKAECDALCALLLEKNASYGNSALDPVRLFSKSSPIEQLLVRIDDKLSRISRGDFTKVKEEDLKVVTKDLLGYLVLVRVAWRLGLE